RHPGRARGHRGLGHPGRLQQDPPVRAHRRPQLHRHERGHHPRRAALRDGVRHTGRAPRHQQRRPEAPRLQRGPGPQHQERLPHPLPLGAAARRSLAAAQGPGRDPAGSRADGALPGEERTQHHALKAPMRIGIVAGESSGDILGAGLMRAIQARVPDVRFEGVAGPLMQAAGCKAIYPAETLAVMGLTEVLAHLPRLLKVRAHLKRHFIADPPDAFIGIDSPDFTLGLEHALRRHGTPTVHYVSPSIWAWRPKRVFKVGEAADLTLALLPFEPPLYEKHGFKSVFVGHPQADAVPEHPDRRALRRELHLGEDDWVVALLPGSRFSEVERLGRLFLETAQWLNLEQPRLRFVIPAATPALNRMLKELIRTTQPDLPVTLVEGHSHDVLGAADAALLASG